MRAEQPTNSLRKIKRAVWLEEGQWRRLEEIKRRTGCPAAESIRRAIDAYCELMLDE